MAAASDDRELVAVNDHDVIELGELNHELSPNHDGAVLIEVALGNSDDQLVARLHDDSFVGTLGDLLK
jgi:hypothetical protein